MKTLETKTTETQIPQLIPTAKVEGAMEIVNETTSLLTSLRRPESATVLEREVQSMKERPYRIAVIGEFKAGKSTLINAAFVGQELLFSDLMEATCVPTELAWGPKPLMKIFPYTEKAHQTIEGSESINIRDGEGEPVEVMAPTAKDIRMETSADSSADREFKARRISRVRVELQTPSLKGITVLDSPGINSTSGAVVDAALRIVPSCDSVIFVTRGGQLSQAEEEFLRSGVLEQGIARAIIVINHFDNLMPLGDEGREDHMDALRAKLRALGKGHLQVAMVDAKGWLESLKSGGPVPQDAIQFSKILGEFLGKDLAKARLEKAMELTKREIRSAMVELAAVAALRKKTESERARIAETLATTTREAGARLDDIQQDFESDFSGHLNQFRNTLKSGITTTINQFKGQLRAAPDLSALAEQLASLQNMIRPQIEARYIDATRTLKRDLQSSSERFSREIRNAISNLDFNTVPDIGKDVSLPPIPAPVVVVLDYLLVIIASPLPMVADIILRLIADRFPEIRKIMPTGLAKSMALGWLEKQLDKQVDATLDEIDRRVNAIKAEAMVSVSKSMQSLLEAEIAPLNRALRSLEVDQPTWSADEVARYESQLKGLYNRTNELSF